MIFNMAVWLRWIVFNNTATLTTWESLVCVCVEGERCDRNTFSLPKSDLSGNLSAESSGVKLYWTETCCLLWLDLVFPCWKDGNTFHLQAAVVLHFFLICCFLHASQGSYFKSLLGSWNQRCYVSIIQTGDWTKRGFAAGITVAKSRNTIHSFIHCKGSLISPEKSSSKQLRQWSAACFKILSSDLFRMKCLLSE